MRKDHVSYMTSHDQLVDTFQRLGSTFVDAGIHPRFGTRNFMLPLQNWHYLEVAFLLHHPSSNSTPFGKRVLQRATEGSGWLTWVVAVDDVSKIEKCLGRAAVDDHRTKPDVKAIAKIIKIEIFGDESRIEEWLGSELRVAIGSDVGAEWVAAAISEGKSGIVAVHVMTPSSVVRLD